MKKLTILTAMAALVTWAACNKSELGNYSAVPILPEQHYEYVPDDAPSWMVNRLLPDGPTDNEDARFIKVTDAGATLGRVLFYDKALSLNNSVACGSCHKQQFGFADPTPFSAGLMPGPTKRNSSHLVNLFDSQNLFWDSRADNLKDMVMMPIQDHIEMGFERIEDLPAKLSQLPYYADLFADAFGNNEITTDKIAVALTQFVKSIVSYKTKYDLHQVGVATLSPLEQEGEQLFFEKYNCSGCHGGHSFGANYGGGVANIGLSKTSDPGVTTIQTVFIGGDMVFVDQIFNPDGFTTDGEFVDPSLFETRTMEGAFKMPFLRNVELTAPYMHDGRFATLEEVIDHYTNVKPSKDLDPRLDKLANGEVTISAYEKKALIAFLKTLTDYSIATEPRYADPFVAR